MAPHKRRGPVWYDDWIFNRNRALLTAYLDDNWEKIEHDSIQRKFKENPYIGYVVLTDYDRNRTNIDINWKAMLKVIQEPGCEIVLITGSKRQGKTYLGWQVLEALHNMGRDVYWVGPPINMPSWCKKAADISDLPQGSYGLFDEAALFLGSRDSNTKENKGTLEHIPTMGQAGVTLLVITQMTSITDISLTRWADVHLIKRTTSIYGGSSERAMVVEDFDFYLSPTDKEWTYFKIGTHRGMLKGPRLPWYDDVNSKPYNLLENPAEAHIYANTLIKAGYDGKYVQKVLKIRGFKRPVGYWDQMVREHNKTQQY